MKPRLTTIKPRLAATSSSRIKPAHVSSNPEAEKRTRGSTWMKIRAKWFRDHPLCVECERTGRITAATQLDHIIPLIDGGKDDESNYQSLCWACHDAKTRREAVARGRTR